MKCYVSSLYHSVVNLIFKRACASYDDGKICKYAFNPGL